MGDADIELSGLLEGLSGIEVAKEVGDDDNDPGNIGVDNEGDNPPDSNEEEENIVNGETVAAERGGNGGLQVLIDDNNGAFNFEPRFRS
jgi:hypothetical protein